MASDASPSTPPESTPPPDPARAEPARAEPGIPEQELSAAVEPAGHLEVMRLLVKAVGLLDTEDRDSVYQYLMERSLAGPSVTPGPLARGLRASLLQDAGLNASVARPAPTSGGQLSGQQLVPVRFAVDQHAALREWCAEHGFSMATVIRGLVARFLEGQGQVPARD